MHETITRYPTVFRDEDGRTYAILGPPKCPTCGEPATRNIIHDPCDSDTWLCRKCSDVQPGEMYAGVWDTHSGDYLELPVQCRCTMCDTGKLNSRCWDQHSVTMICDSCATEMEILDAMTQFGRGNVRISEFDTTDNTEEKPLIVQKLTPYERENLLEGLLERMRVAYHDLQPLKPSLSDIHLLAAVINCVRKMGEDT